MLQRSSMCCLQLCCLLACLLQLQLQACHLLLGRQELGMLLLLLLLLLLNIAATVICRVLLTGPAGLDGSHFVPERCHLRVFW